MTLRGVSPYNTEATVKWKQTPRKWHARWAAIGVALGCVALSSALLLNAFAGRLPWDKLRRSKQPNKLETTTPHGTTESLSSEEPPIPSGYATPLPIYQTRPPSRASEREAPPMPYVLPEEEHDTIEQAPRDAGHGHLHEGDQVEIPTRSEDGFAMGMATEGLTHGHPTLITRASANDPEVAEGKPEVITTERVEVEDSRKDPNVTVPAAQPATVVAAGAVAGVPRVRQRVDYLAGLVAMSALIVTMTHFALTFFPAIFEPGTYTHYKSENWARKTIDSFALNQNWIGPFLMTSTRFLITNYLRTGNLKNIAEKVVGRIFRLLVPITAIVLLEYFFINVGATKWLEYLASVTWSTWPFTVGFTNFGNFVSELLELLYLIPNAAPQLTFNYCTGVLWTVPVQLQGSWIVMLGVIIIREIKTPWKRFSFYAFNILNNWYGLNWGSYFWSGLMLADLDITYKYRKWLYPRPWAYYPLILTAFVFGFGGLSMDLATQWTGVAYATKEYGIHPDTNSGLPIVQTQSVDYPDYYVPRLNGLCFTVGFQALIELSPFVQKLMSSKVLVFFFPHIFTIYLIHGFIFWSLGSWVCVGLSAAGIPYWANMLITTVVCYATLILSLPVLTPVNDVLGKGITANVWQYAHEKPVPRKPTLYPFPRDLFLGYSAVPEEQEEAVRDELVHDNYAAEHPQEQAVAQHTAEVRLEDAVHPHTEYPQDEKKNLDY